eukprot:scaffold41485_cov51-Phaeocystis_antarctica.AAC.3
MEICCVLGFSYVLGLPPPPSPPAGDRSAAGPVKAEGAAAAAEAQAAARRVVRGRGRATPQTSAWAWARAKKGGRASGSAATPARLTGAVGCASSSGLLRRTWRQKPQSTFPPAPHGSHPSDPAHDGGAAFSDNQKHEAP